MKPVVCLVVVLAAGLATCTPGSGGGEPDTITVSGKVDGSNAPQKLGAKTLGVPTGNKAATGLAIVAMDTSGQTTRCDLTPDWQFALTLKVNTSYTLNVLDKTRNVFVGSFLYHSGSSIELALKVGTTDIDLGSCELLNGEVWCDNGFFDSPTSSAVVEVPNDIYGQVRIAVQPATTDTALVTQLLGGTATGGFIYLDDTAVVQ